jgi:hypothetical protein
MATLVLTIKTTGEAWDSLSVATQAHLLASAERGTRRQAERQLWRDVVKESLGHSPFTGSLVGLGVFDRERGVGVVHTGIGSVMANVGTPGVTHKVCTETKMLTDFWDGVRQYDTVVTFGGRSFVIPFLLQRSVICGVAPTVELLGKRLLRQQQPPYHIDLQDELSFYGALYPRPSLHLVSRAYGIASEAGLEQSLSVPIGAGDVDILVHELARDLVATAAVYEKWLEYLAPRDFVQNIDF